MRPSPRRSIRSGSTTSSTSKTSTTWPRSASASPRWPPPWRDSPTKTSSRKSSPASRGRTPGLDKSVKQAEFETLVSTKEEIGSDKPDGDFFARYLPKKHWDQPWMAAVERVVLVHRLREVIATVGFTRFESSSPDVEGELEIGVTRAQLARDVSWLPAIENRGEGIFIQFQSEAIDAWMEKPAVKRRGEQLDGGLRLLEEGPRQEQSQVLRASLHPAPFAVAPADHRRSPSNAATRPARSGNASTRAPTAMASCSTPGRPTPKARWEAWSQAGRQIARHLKAAIDLGPALLERPGLCPARPGEPARMPVPARGRLPRLPADRGDVLRAAQRLPRPGPGDLHGGRQRCRVLRHDGT